tara:strand:- start:132 stop:1196 length:1065 start_codon:yes stop_codon:yes gene_type:complete
MSYVSLISVKKRFGDFEILKGVDLDIERQQFTVLVGPSGCGKSTTLRLLAGLEPISGGQIFIDGRDVTALEPRERDIAMVFQNYALYPTMTVEQNMSFGLKAKNMPAAEIRTAVHNAAELLDITTLLARKPGALSGGQQQRVAIGRAIVRQPKLFLFDEPLSNLDAKLRVETRAEILGLHKRLKATTIYVTHDQEEAMTMADKIVIMNQGMIEQQGTPEDVFFRPASRMVAGFIGSPAMNFFDGVGVANGDIETEVGTFKGFPQIQLGQQVEVGIRPDDLIPVVQGGNTITGRVKLSELLGVRAIIHLATENGSAFKAVVDHEIYRDMKRADRASFTVRDGRLHIFDRQSGRRL